VVVHKGRIVGEQYGEGADLHTQHESWSMGKSLTAILYGRLVNEEGKFDPFKPAPFESWLHDERNTIQIADLFRMSSGLTFSSRGDNPETWDHAHPDHSLIYSGGIDSFTFSLTRPAEHPPNTVGRYRNCDPLLVGLIIKQTVEARGENYLAWPQKVLFDKLGIQHMTLEPDPYGNFLLTGYDYGSARDWARLGMLVLRDGVWEGERLLPEGFVEFITTPAPGWENGEYGGLVWLNTQGNWNLPKSAYRFAGHGTQHVYIVPTLDLVIVRMGHLRGSNAVGRPLNEAVGKIAEAVGG
jgi:CubicO group peptidase (beta-lactamase class C family)